jgi:hypothetical protein
VGPFTIEIQGCHILFVALPAAASGLKCPQLPHIYDYSVLSGLWTRSDLSGMSSHLNWKLMPTVPNNATKNVLIHQLWKFLH